MCNDGVLVQSRQRQGSLAQHGAILGTACRRGGARRNGAHRERLTAALRVLHQCVPARFLLLAIVIFEYGPNFIPRALLSAALSFARSMSLCAFAFQWTVQATRSQGAASPPLRADSSADTVTPPRGGPKSRFASRHGVDRIGIYPQ